MKAVLTSVREVEASPDTVRVASLYDFWAFVHEHQFPSHIDLGKLDSYDITTKDFVLDLTWRDIDTKFQVIPKSFDMSHITINKELDEASRELLRDHLEKYFAFRATIVKAKAKKPTPTIITE